MPVAGKWLVDYEPVEAALSVRGVARDLTPNDFRMTALLARVTPSELGQITQMPSHDDTQCGYPQCSSRP